MAFLHVTSPVKVGKNKDLYFAQPITFETFRLAKEFSNELTQVNQCTVQFKEDREIIPSYISILNNLSSSLKDYGDFAYKYPLIKEILDISFSHISNEDYIIYSNSDISLMPFFYTFIEKYVQNGYDAIVINRRSITDKYQEIEDIPLMWAEIGEKHIGWDCFIFRKDLYPKFILKNTVLGAVGIGRALLFNLKFFAKNFIEIKDHHLTFHIGNSPTTDRQYTEHSWIRANLYNDEQLEQILSEMQLINERAVAWINEELTQIAARRKKYLEGLNGIRRFKGYWHIKKTLSYFNSDYK